MPKRLGELPVGTLIKDPETTYYDEPIVWKIADKNHSGYPSNTVTLITDKIISLKAFDGTELNNSDRDIRLYGNNYYKHSNLLQWLNSDKNSWYTAKHGADDPPNSSNTDYNPYDSEPGFLYDFSSDFRNAMVSTSLKTARPELDGGGSETVTSKIFLASATEVGLDNEDDENGIAEGTKFPIFDDDESRKAYPTEEAVSKSDYTSSSLKASSPWQWWLRTPYASYSCEIRVVADDGSWYWGDAYDGSCGVRPLCNLKSEILVSDSPETDGTYSIIYNIPLTIDSSSPSNLGNKADNFKITYTVTGPDNDTTTVIEYSNSTKIREYTPELGKTQTLTIPESTWKRILNGKNTIKIVATDAVGNETAKTFNYTKNVTKIVFTLSKPLEADDMVSKALINIVASIPEGATKKIELCNNAYDAEPTWEDVTTHLDRGSKIFLQNTKKTASKWGFNVRVTVDRNGASGDCNISAIGGNFE